MGLFISDALAAATAGPGPQDSGIFSFVMIGVIFVLFYFMLIRPQNKRAKEHRDLLSQIKKGDEVVTSTGMLGKVTQVDEQYIKLSVADGFEISFQKHAVGAILPKGTLKSL